MSDHDILEHLHRRMDKTDELLRDIHNRLIAHISREEEIKPALDELVSMWRGSKLIVPILAGLAAFVAAVWGWAKEHIK